MAPTAATLSSSVYTGHLTDGDPTKAAKTYKPTHPGKFEVQFRDGEYNSCLVALRVSMSNPAFPSWMITNLRRTVQDYAEGETIAMMSHASPSKAIRYSTVQVTEADHIELNSDLLYCNHSCNPSVHFNVSSSDPSQWRAEALRDIKAGDLLEFFYPSTEWDMRQPFDCSCGATSCLKRISGAKYLAPDVLQRYAVNDHIKRLKAQQQAATSA